MTAALRDHPSRRTRGSEHARRRSAPTSRTAKVIGWVLVGLCLLTVIGCFGTWTEAVLHSPLHIHARATMTGFGHVTATYGPTSDVDKITDGLPITILAIIVVIPAVLRGFGKVPTLGAFVATIGGALITTICVIELHNLGLHGKSTGPTDHIIVSAGWGMWMTTMVGFAMVMVGIAGLVKRH